MGAQSVTAGCSPGHSQAQQFAHQTPPCLGARCVCTLRAAHPAAAKQQQCQSGARLRRPHRPRRQLQTQPFSHGDTSSSSGTAQHASGARVTANSSLTEMVPPCLAAHTCPEVSSWKGKAPAGWSERWSSSSSSGDGSPTPPGPSAMDPQHHQGPLLPTAPAVLAAGSSEKGTNSQATALTRQTAFP